VAFTSASGLLVVVDLKSLKVNLGADKPPPFDIGLG